MPLIEVSRYAGILVLATALSGCSTLMAFVETKPKTECLVFQPISWSKKDTEQTVREIKEHNAVFMALCK